MAEAAAALAEAVRSAAGAASVQGAITATLASSALNSGDVVSSAVAAAAATTFYNRAAQLYGKGALCPEAAAAAAEADKATAAATAAAASTGNFTPLTTWGSKLHCFHATSQPPLLIALQPAGIQLCSGQVRSSARNSYTSMFPNVRCRYPKRCSIRQSGGLGCSSGGTQMRGRCLWIVLTSLLSCNCSTLPALAEAHFRPTFTAPTFHRAHICMQCPLGWHGD